MNLKHALLTVCIAASQFFASAQWTEICGTGNGFVVDFEVHNDALYATGFFTTLCGQSNVHVSEWGLAGWQTPNGGLPEAGHSLSVIDNQLYATTYEVNATDSNWLYVQNGLLQKVGAGVYLTTATNGSNVPNIYNAIGYGNDIVICGEFNRVGSQTISGIASWNGTDWESLGTGLSGSISGSAPVMYPHDLCTFGNDLVVAGNFGSAGGQTVNGIARWDGAQWHAFADGFDGPVYGIAVYNGELYAGGEFTHSGATALPHHIARWNGSAWIDPGFGGYYSNPGYFSYIHTLKELNGKLYFSGGFDRVVSGNDTLIGTAIAAFDGMSVDTLDGGIPGKEIEALAYFNGHIYAGGGLNGSSYIARYDGVAALPEFTVNWKIATDLFAHTALIESPEPVDEWIVTDLCGRIVYRSDHASETLAFSVKNAGIYCISARFGDRLLSRKTAL